MFMERDIQCLLQLVQEIFSPDNIFDFSKNMFMEIERDDFNKFPRTYLPSVNLTTSLITEYKK